MLATPPFLIGLTLLFWGWQTQTLMLAIPMAVVLEASHWIKFRIDFSIVDFNRIWDLCCVLAAMAGLYCFLNRETVGELADLFRASTFGSKYAATKQLSSAGMIFFQWWPMLLFLMAAAQAYGPREIIPYSSFSLFARRHLKRKGLPQPEKPGVNFAFPYFGVCLFAASLPLRNQKYYFWVFIVLSVWGLWAVRPRRFNAVAWLIVMGACVAGGYVGQANLLTIAARVEGQFTTWMSKLLQGKRQGSKEFDTSIGDVAGLKGSGAIVMRVTAREHVPRLLRSVTYNVYERRTWDLADKVAYLNVPPSVGGESWFLQDAPEASNSVQIATTLGRVPTVLARPSGTAIIDDLPVGELTTNMLGSVRAFDGPPFVMYKVIYGATNTLDAEPTWIRDGGRKTAERHVPNAEQRALIRVADEIGIYVGQPEKEMVGRVYEFLTEEFEYSLNVPRRPPQGSKQKTLMSHFLLESRKGHCEMFATAAALLLREKGVATRYVLGWAVMEEGKYDHEYIVRERHAHAWCQWWSIEDGRWYDLDTTPGGWFEIEQGRADWSEPISDWWSNLMHSFRMWRYYGDSGNLQNYLLSALAVLVAILAWRLLFRRRKRGNLTEDDSFWEFAKLGLDSEFYEIQRRIESLGLVRRDGESLLDWVERIEGHQEVRPELLKEIVRLHYRYRFDPNGLSDNDRGRLKKVVHEWLAPLPVTA